MEEVTIKENTTYLKELTLFVCCMTSQLRLVDLLHSFLKLDVDEHFDENTLNFLWSLRLGAALLTMTLDFVDA